MSERKERLIAELAEARAGLVAAVRGLSEEQLARPTANDGWSVKDTFGHVAQAEGGMLVLLERSLNGEPGVVEGFDLRRFNEGRVRRARERSIADLLAGLEDSRAKLLAILEPLDDADLDRPAQHPALGDTTFEGIVKIIASHERAHTKDIADAVKA